MFVLIYNFDFFVRAYTVNNLSNFTVMRNASGVNQFKAVDQNGNNGMLFKVKDNSEFSVNVWKDNAFGNEKILATKDDLYPSYAQVTLFSDVKADVTDKSITITENGMVQVAAKTQAIDGTAFIRLIINGACVYEGHTVSGKYRYLWTPIFPVKKGDIIKVTLQTGTTDGQRFVYFYKS